MTEKQPNNSKHKHFILGSSSPGRLALLKSVGIIPDEVIAPDIDESPLKKEKPRDLALRLATAKCKKLQEVLNSRPDTVILCADTVSAVGRRIVDKALTDDDVRKCMKMLSGKNHRVYSAFAAMSFNSAGEIENRATKVVETRISFKHLSHDDIEEMVATKEGIGKSGGYSISGFVSSFVIKIVGMPSNIIGLPLYNVRNTLLSMGCKSSILPKKQ